MSYHQGENVIDHSYCEADLVRSAKANVRFFIEILIGGVIALALLGLLGSTLLGTLSCFGSCLGCEACLETAATADSCIEDMGCEDCSDNYYDDMGCWEEMATENIETANECASCEGIDCFGRQGCFASEGCGDCDHCAGTMYYTVTFVAGDTSKTVEVNEDQTSVSVYYPSGVDSSYYKFLGYYDKESGGKMYVDASGYIVKTLKDNLTLYGRYQEYRVNEAITFNLQLAEFGMHNETISLTVGSKMSTIPTAPEKEGYNFVGWYIGDRLVHKGNIGQDQTFHLYTFGLEPSAVGPYTLTPRYEEKTYTITFVVYNNPYQIKAKYNDTYGTVYGKFYSQYYSLQNDDTFFGWATSTSAAPEDKITGDTKIEQDTTLYPIFRQSVKVRFYYNRNGWDSEYAEVKLYEGQTDVYFENLEELNYVKSEGIHPGYKFAGWYTSSSGSSGAQAQDRIPLVSTSITKSYYAHWTATDYKIEYYAMHYDSNTQNQIDMQTYNYSGSTINLRESATTNYGYEFVGWCLNEDCSDTPRMTLDAYTYGDKKLYAKYQSITFVYTWDAYPGTVNGWESDTESMVYGQANQLPMPTLEGYNFLGWKLDGTDVWVTDETGYVDKFTFKTLGMENTLNSETKLKEESFMLVAGWEIQKFTVTFTVDGRTVDEQTIDWGKYIVEPEAPTKTGYKFKWWTDENGNRFYPSAQIKKDWTLKAYFEIEKYTVIFNVDGTDCKAYGVPHGTTIAEAESYVSSWPGYTGTVPRKQIGWFDSSAEGATEIEADTPIERNEVKVYAQFEYAKTFTFIGATQETEFYFVGEEHIFPEAYQKGYTFLGWGTSESDSTVTVAKDKKVRIKADTTTTYYAKFEAKVYNITYYVGNVEYASDTYTIEDEKQLISTTSSKAPSKVGYTFVGWKIDTNGDYIGEGELVTVLIENTEHKAFIAQFENNVYQVTLKDEGCNVGINVVYDQTFNFGTPLEERDGCKFVGWAWKRYDVDDANKEIITDENGLSKGIYNLDDDRNAYPVFERIQYPFYWYVDGTVKAETYQKHFDESVSAPANPVKEGYTFVGWYKDFALTEEYDFNHEVVGSEHIYAKFSINQYTVKFMVGDEVKKTVTLDYRTNLATVINEAQTYVDAYATEQTAKFKHWKDANKGTVYTADSVVPAYNVTLMAVFNMPIYVHFDYGYDEKTLDSEALYDGAKVSIADPIRDGYDFDGWYKDGTTETEFPIYVSGSEQSRTDCYYVAKWTPITYNIYYYIHNGSYYELKKTGEYSMNQTEETGGFTLWNGGENAGYVLDGWYIDGSGTAISAIDNTAKAEGEKTCGTLSLYASWTLQKYTITFKGIDGTIYETIEVTYGQTLDKQNWVSDVANGPKPDGATSLRGFVLDGTNTLYMNADGKWAGNFGTFNWMKDIVLVAAWRYQT